MVLGYAIVMAIWLLGFGAIILYLRRNGRLRANGRMWNACFLGWVVALLPLLLLVTPADSDAVKVVVKNWLLYWFAPMFLGVIAVSIFSGDR